MSGFLLTPDTRHLTPMHPQGSLDVTPPPIRLPALASQSSFRPGGRLGRPLRCPGRGSFLQRGSRVAPPRRPKKPAHRPQAHNGRQHAQTPFKTRRRPTTPSPCGPGLVCCTGWSKPSTSQLKHSTDSNREGTQKQSPDTRRWRLPDGQASSENDLSTDEVRAKRQRMSQSAAVATPSEPRAFEPSGNARPMPAARPQRHAAMVRNVGTAHQNPSQRSQSLGDAHPPASAPSSPGVNRRNPRTPHHHANAPGDRRLPRHPAEQRRKHAVLSQNVGLVRRGVRRPRALDCTSREPAFAAPRPSRKPINQNLPSRLRSRQIIA